MQQSIGKRVLWGITKQRDRSFQPQEVLGAESILRLKGNRRQKARFLQVRFWTWWRKDRAVGEPFVQTIQLFLGFLGVQFLVLQMVMPYTSMRKPQRSILKPTLFFAHLSLPLLKTITPCLQEINLHVLSILNSPRENLILTFVTVVSF